MDVDVYKSKISPSPRETIFILVRSGSNIEDLPEHVKQEHGELIFHKKITIKRGEKRIALDPNEAINQIENEGYFIQSTKIEFHIKVGNT